MTEKCQSRNMNLLLGLGTESGATNLQETGAPDSFTEWIFKLTEYFTLLQLPINEVFNTIKDQLWIRHRDQSDTILHLSEQKSIVPITTVKGVRLFIDGASENT